MKKMRTVLATGIRWLLVLGCFLLPLAMHAEVGSIRQDPITGTGLSFPYVYAGITDDPDPVLDIWSPIHDNDPIHQILNPDGTTNGDGAPSMLLNRFSGLVMAAWARNSAEGYDVVIATQDGNGWSEPQVVAGDTSVDELDPHLSIDPSDGSVHLFYWVHDAVPAVMHRNAPADLSSWSVPEAVSSPGQAACRPAGVFHDGTLYVAYEVHDYGFGASPRQVVLASRDTGGFQPEVVAVTYHDGEQRPGVHTHNGSLWVDWIDATGEMAWAVRDAQSGWGSVQYEPFTDLEDREFHARNRIRVLASH